jgi:NAD(P)-dependent dehydrogenase (short-subunit alcohol dehydrogenase family)
VDAVLDKNVFDISGRVAIVTGGSRGLGRACCEILAKYGADVVCVGRDGEALAETARLVAEYGHAVLPLSVDVTSADSVQEMADQAVARFGRIDILVANAGITTPYMRIDEEDIESWDRIITGNLRSQFLSMKAVLPVMMEQHSGSIINISSVGAFGGGEVAPASYGASKAGIIALSKHAACQYGKYGIRVNCICPGIHITDLGMPTDPAERQQRLTLLDEMSAQLFPLGRVAYPQELEGLVALLASDASSYITGATFIQDGGHTAKV